MPYQQFPMYQQPMGYHDPMAYGYMPEAPSGYRDHMGRYAVRPG